MKVELERIRENNQDFEIHIKRNYLHEFYKINGNKKILSKRIYWYEESNERQKQLEKIYDDNKNLVSCTYYDRNQSPIAKMTSKISMNLLGNKSKMVEDWSFFYPIFNGIKLKFEVNFKYGNLFERFNSESSSIMAEGKMSYIKKNGTLKEKEIWSGVGSDVNQYTCLNEIPYPIIKKMNLFRVLVIC